MSFCKYQEQEWVLPLGRNRWFSTSSRILVFLHSIKSNPFFSVEGNIPLKSLVIFSIYGIIKEKKKKKKCLLAVISRNILTNKLFDSVLYQRWLNYFSLNFLSFSQLFIRVSRLFIFIKILIADINFCCW